MNYCSVGANLVFALNLMIPACQRAITRVVPTLFDPVGYWNIFEQLRLTITPMSSISPYLNWLSA